METKKEHSNLAKSIIHTLAFFAAQEKPLTLLELQISLVRTDEGQQPASLSQILLAIKTELAGQVMSADGIYFLTKHAQTMDRRRETYNQSLALLLKSKRWARGLRHLPFIRGAAVSGSVAQLNASSTSDIDLFIIAQPGRVFLARFFASLYFHIFGGRRHGQKILGRFCLNHYLAQGQILTSDRNLYTAMEYVSLLPVFGQKYFEEFWKNNENWIRGFLVAPQWPVSAFFDCPFQSSALQHAQEFLLAPFSAALEKVFSYFQKRRIQTSSFVMASDSELSFHPDSKGQHFLAKYQLIVGDI